MISNVDIKEIMVTEKYVIGYIEEIDIVQSQEKNDVYDTMGTRNSKEGDWYNKNG